VLAVQNITKTFPGVTALRSVSMELMPGKVNAILGENGAGKSTLMKILSGVYVDYEGDILLHGKPVRFEDVKDAQARGIAIIHQELNTFPHLTVYENIFLGRELLDRFGLLDKKAMQEKTTLLLRRLKMPVDPRKRVGELKVGQQQVLEIAKALLTESQVIIMDEPTSAISEGEVETLFGIIADLKASGKTIVYISHKVNEVLRIADRYVVMRDGACVESGDMPGMSPDELIRKMVGREVHQVHKPALNKHAEELMRVEGLSWKPQADGSGKMLDDISFSLHKGEILGIFGLMGAGRTELVETIFGLHPGRSRFKISIEGVALRLRSTADALDAGLALVPEDRKKDGLVLGLDVSSNINLASLQQHGSSFLLNEKQETAVAKKYIGELNIKTPSLGQLARNLSGGNQQKIVLAKWLATHPRILLLDEPTRGIDVNAKAEIYKLIQKLSAEGLGIVLVSSELPEILTLSHRVLVMCEGKLAMTVPIDEATEDRILKAAIPKTND